MASLWNPYAALPPGTRRTLGIFAVALVLIVWSVLSGLELVSATRLPAPWSVMKAMSYLAWSEERGSLLTA